MVSYYDSTIDNYVFGTSNHCADCMLRLPLPRQSLDSAEKTHVLVQIQELPVIDLKIMKESLQDQQFPTRL